MMGYPRRLAAIVSAVSAGVFAASPASSSLVAPPGLVGYTLSADGSSYAVTLDGAPWLVSSAAAYTIRSGHTTLTSRDGSLKADGAPTPASGSDALGSWAGASMSFNGGLFEASFQLYAARNTLSLVQRFPRGLASMELPTANADQDLTTAFPAFLPPAPGTLAYVSWANCMCNGNVGLYGGAGQGANIGPESGPLALFNAAGTTLVLSPGSAFMTSQLAHAAIVNDTGCIAAGLNGMVTDVPAGWTYDTLFVGGVGTNDTMMAWGDALLARTGKTRTAPNADLIVSTLGYWTDNGTSPFHTDLTPTAPLFFPPSSHHLLLVRSPRFWPLQARTTTISQRSARRCRTR